MQYKKLSDFFSKLYLSNHDKCFNYHNDNTFEIGQTFHDLLKTLIHVYLWILNCLLKLYVTCYNI